MKTWLPTLGLLGACAAAPGAPPDLRPPPDPADLRAPRYDQAASVLQHQNGPTRPGRYQLTWGPDALAQARLRRVAALRGPTYAPPLYLAGTAPADDLLIVATEQNQVLAVRPDGTVVWERELGPAAPRSAFYCGNIDPLGVTGTPIIDLDAETLYLNSVTSADGQAVAHRLFGLALEDGAPRPGWPLSLGEAVRTDGVAFLPRAQNQRGALGLLDGALYVPYGAHQGDCDDYRGWLVSVPLRAGSPAGAPAAWVAPQHGGGLWAPGGVVISDGALYVAAGNSAARDRGTWRQADALLRLQPGPRFSGEERDYFAPSDWTHRDLSGHAPILLDLPGATPPRLLLGLGKDGLGYLADRDQLGGIGAGVAQAALARTYLIGSAAQFPSPEGLRVVFKGGPGQGCASGSLTAVEIQPAAPPRVQVAWCADGTALGSPMVTLHGAAAPLVWAVAAEGDGRLRAFDGATGAPRFESAPLGSVRRYQVPIAGRDRIYVAADEALWALEVAP